MEAVVASIAEEQLIVAVAGATLHATDIAVIGALNDDVLSGGHYIGHRFELPGRKRRTAGGLSAADGAFEGEELVSGSRGGGGRSHEGGRAVKAREGGMERREGGRITKIKKKEKRKIQSDWMGQRRSSLCSVKEVDDRERNTWGKHPGVVWSGCGAHATLR